ncbi:MAG: zeta toxin family protein [Candidatus Cloacimonetes bacterium]|nr:zeta toxin family protein [Candidatus Cloacimonadota bacterium]
MKNKTVYLVCGCNGSGKTTFAKEFINQKDIAFLNADEIEREFNPDDMSGGKIRAGREFFKRFDILIKESNDFVIESTIAGRVLLKYLRLLKKQKYRIILLYLFLDNTEMAINRVRIRIEEGGHQIPDADIIRRYSRSLSNFWNLYKNQVDEWQLFYNGDDAVMQTAVGIVDKFIIINEDRFEIFMRGINV